MSKLMIGISHDAWHDVTECVLWTITFDFYGRIIGELIIDLISLIREGRECEMG